MPAMVRTVSTWALRSALLLAAACSSIPPVNPAAEQHVTAAETQVTAGAFDQARTELDEVAGERCPKRLRDRRDVALATAWRGLGDDWEAFRVLEPFPDLYPHSDLRGKVVDMEWEIGDKLSKSDRGFLFFWSDARAARVVLEHLITRHPDTTRLADALKILGDMAFADGDYPLAQARYRDLMLNRPDSEWFGYAQFRFAMSIVACIEGPEYDLDRMQAAVKELRSFLAGNSEQADLVRQAREAEQRVLEMQIQRHLAIAGFYRRIGNLAGQRHHLTIAASTEFASTPQHRDAIEALNALPRSGAGSTP